jgi:hypothetical protein
LRYERKRGGKKINRLDRREEKRGRGKSES